MTIFDLLPVVVLFRSPIQPDRSLSRAKRTITSPAMESDQPRRRATRGAKEYAALLEGKTRIRTVVPSPRALNVRGEAAAALTLLVVEDEAILRAMIAELLRARVGCHVIEAIHGADAQRIINEGTSIHLLLTDLSMPLMNGFDLVRWFRTRDQMTPVVAMSGSLRELNRFLDGQERIPLLVKPFSPDQLIAMIDAALARPGAAFGSGPARAAASTRPRSTEETWSNETWEETWRRRSSRRIVLR